MSRFREEVYNAKWYKALKKKAAKSAELLPESEDPRPSAVRVEYFAKSRKGHRKSAKEPRSNSVRMF